MFSTERLVSMVMNKKLKKKKKVLTDRFDMDFHWFSLYVFRLC